VIAKSAWPKDVFWPDMQLLIPRIRAWWLLWLAAVITMTIVAASQLFTDRIGLLLERQASELLAADLLVSSNEPLPQGYRSLAERYGLQTALSVELRTAIFVDDNPQLVELKAVSDGYPLRGTLERSDERAGQVEKLQQGPMPGQLWVDNKLAAQLGGYIELGYSRLPVPWLLTYEPDRGGSLFNLAPRILMHLDDLSDTGLLVAGSRAKYKLLVAGETTAIERFASALKLQLTEGQQLQSLENARPEMRNALQRTDRFFSLSIIMTLVIAMVAIAITARYAASQEATKVSVMRTFGISSRRLMFHYLWQIGKVWLWAAPAGLLLGQLAQYPLQWALGFWFSSSLPDASWQPFALSALVGLISLGGFSLPPLLRVIDTPPMQVLRQFNQRSSALKSVILSASSLLTLFVVLLLIVPDVSMAALVFGLILAIALFIPAVLRFFLFMFGRLGQGRFWLKSYVLSRLLSTNRNALFVMSGFSLTLLSVLLISLVKDQLIQDWETQLPQNKPNYFLVNIPTADVESLTDFLQGNEIASSGAYALVRGRLKSINQQAVGDLEFPSERGQRLKNHVFNISYSEQLPVDNEIVAGQWLQPDSMDEFSVEQGMAEDMGRKLRDELEFAVGGESFTARISSIRSVVWENFRPNFYLIGTARQLQDKPQTWLLSARINDDQKHLLKPLVRAFPSITLLDISEVMQRVKGIIDRASLALQFFFVFAIVAAVIVLLSALNTANHDRQMEIALLQALGAGYRHKLLSQVSEFVLMGIVVGIFAALFASLSGYLIGSRFFDLPFVFRPEIWLYSVISAVLSITLLGTLFIHRSFKISPMRLLRS